MCITECKDKSKRGASFLFNSKGYKAKACWHRHKGWGIWILWTSILKLKRVRNVFVRTLFKCLSILLGLCIAAYNVEDHSNRPGRRRWSSCPEIFLLWFLNASNFLVGAWVTGDTFVEKEQGKRRTRTNSDDGKGGVVIYLMAILFNLVWTYDIAVYHYRILFVVLVWQCFSHLFFSLFFVRAFLPHIKFVAALDSLLMM